MVLSLQRLAYGLSCTDPAITTDFELGVSLVQDADNKVIDCKKLFEGDKFTLTCSNSFILKWTESTRDKNEIFRTNVDFNKFINYNTTMNHLKCIMDVNNDALFYFYEKADNKWHFCKIASIKHLNKFLIVAATDSEHKIVHFCCILSRKI